MDKQIKRHQSCVWTRFERYERDGNKLMKCKECGLELKTHLASNAKRHLRTVHQLVEPDLNDLLERKDNKSAPERLNDQMHSLFLEKQRLWMETYTIGITIAHIIISPAGGSPEDSKPQSLARKCHREGGQKRKSRTLQTQQAVSRHRLRVASAKTKICQLQHEVELFQCIRQCPAAIAENLLDIQQFAHARDDVSRPTYLNRDMSVGSFIAAYMDFAAGYALERPTEGDAAQLAAQIPKGQWITAAAEMTPSETGLVQKCLQCVPLWRMAEGIAIEPHGGCRSDVVMDVFRANNAATVSFNFYESCARAVACLRKFLQANIHHLPRELALQAHLISVKNSFYVKLSRQWAFEDDIGKTFDKSNVYAVHRPLGTLKRYTIERLYICFDAGGLHFLDFLLDSFRGCIASAKVRDVEVYGFSKVPVVYGEEIDRIKECLRLMNIKNKLWFRFTELGQLDALFRNTRDFPNIQHLRISLEKTDVDNMLTGEAVARTLCALSGTRNPVLAIENVHIDVSGISMPAPVLCPILDARADISWHQRLLRLFAHQKMFDVIVRTVNEANLILVLFYNAARGPYGIFLNDQVPSYAEPTNDAVF